MIARRSLPLVSAALLLAACQQDTEFSGSFDTPAAVAVLDPTLGGPFSHSVAYAANRHGGQIRVLDVDTGRYLVDDPFASFFRGNALPTGAERLIVDLAAVAPDATTVNVWALDARFRQLLLIPHVNGADRLGPVERGPELTSSTFDDVDGSGDSVTAAELVLDPDGATSETWTLTSRGAWWSVVGTRSGEQPRAYVDMPWRSNDGSLTFVLRGDSTPGDTLTIVVDRGVVETDLDGVPRQLALAPDGGDAALVWSDEDGGGHVTWFDPVVGTLGDEVTLPEGTRVGRVAWSSADALWITDTTAPQLWRVARGDTTPTAVPLPFATQDLAVLADPILGTRLFIVPLEGQEVWVLDGATERLIDVNPATGDVDPVRMRSPVRGLAAIQEPYRIPDADGDDEIDVFTRSVAVSLHSGKVVWMKPDGCLVADGPGPRTELTSSVQQLEDYEPTFDVVIPGTAYLEELEDDNRHVAVNACAGTAPPESWIARFDAVQQAWSLEGTVSGKQSTMAREDERYVSDRAEVSFALRAGAYPSEDGWAFTFNVLDGVLDAEGDNDENGTREIDLDLPGVPVIAYKDVNGKRRAYVVVAAESSDVVTRIDSTSGKIDALWD